MDEKQNNVVELIRRSLAASSGAQGVKGVPILLIERPDGLQSWSSTDAGTSADLALAYYYSHGFLADRTRMNLYGYPGLLSTLSNPPPWIEVEPEDVDGGISEDRADELCPLIVHAQEHAVESLVSRYRSEQQHKALVLERFVGLASSSVVTEVGADSFRDLVGLAKVLGVALFEAIYDAVFEFDEFTLLLHKIGPCGSCGVEMISPKNHPKGSRDRANTGDGAAVPIVCIDAARATSCYFIGTAGLHRRSGLAGDLV